VALEDCTMGRPCSILAVVLIAAYAATGSMPKVLRGEALAHYRGSAPCDTTGLSKQSCGITPLCKDKKWDKCNDSNPGHNNAHCDKGEGAPLPCPEACQLAPGNEDTTTTPCTGE